MVINLVFGGGVKHVVVGDQRGNKIRPSSVQASAQGNFSVTINDDGWDLEAIGPETTPCLFVINYPGYGGQAQASWIVTIDQALTQVEIID